MGAIGAASFAVISTSRNYMNSLVVFSSLRMGVMGPTTARDTSEG